ncbi:hypothetical protein [Longimicrobium sp.]|uniref:hypothetical protein n=1 Tax=Longimicrobium sp. TaxID=2029185 RepID=UPI002D0B9F6E|nr:hypothetical protein [Longimicrobium sp.]HSU17398.1 hypothetical protein [Longimicrobium sp.]
MNLNAAHIHLLVNHIPVFGTVFAALLIAWGLLRKSEDVLRLGLAVAVIVAAGTWLVQLTGEPAEHLIAGMQDVQRRIIHQHEEAAELSTWVITAFGVLSLITLVLVHRRRASGGRALAILSLLTGLAGAGLVARAANLGGEIRHPEIRAGFVPPPPPPRPAGAPRGEGGERD